MCVVPAQLVGIPFGPANLVLGLPRNSPLTMPLSNAIMQLRGNGVIDQLKRRWVDDLDQCSSAESQARPARCRCRRLPQLLQASGHLPWQR